MKTKNLTMLVVGIFSGLLVGGLAGYSLAPPSAPEFALRTDWEGASGRPAPNDPWESESSRLAREDIRAGWDLLAANPDLPGHNVLLRSLKGYEAYLEDSIYAISRQVESLRSEE